MEIKEHDLYNLLSVNQQLAEENRLFGKRLSKLEEENKWLKEQLKLAKSRKFGKSSEKSECLQFELFGEDSPDLLIKEEMPESIVTTTSEHHRKEKKGRCIDTSKLPREVKIHDLTNEKKCCQCCKNPLVKIGEDRSEQLEIIPAKIKVIEHVRMKYACRTCDTVTAGEKPASPIPKSMAGASLLAAVILSKYQYHLPMYRQSQIFLSNGIDIPANTLVNWALSAFDVIAPIKTVFWEQLKSIHALQADETRVKRLDINKQGYMWCYLSCDPKNKFVLFAYNESRGSSVVNNHLASYAGKLQTDGYSGYNSLREKNDIVSIGCFAHCRRKFVEVQKLTANKSGKAQHAIELIRKLYEIEAEVRNLSFFARQLIRQEKAKPLLEEFHQWLSLSAQQVGKKSKLGNAIGYALNQWEYLKAYCDYGEVEIDNNWVENQIRPFALGRKNWLFIGNQRGADAAALFYSLIRTCKLNDVPPGPYFTYLLSKAEAMRKGVIDLKSLLPQFIDRSKLDLEV
jgi:transposase